MDPCQEVSFPGILFLEKLARTPRQLNLILMEPAGH